MNDIKLIIAKNICQLRKEAGYTQIELAEKLNYSDKSISKWERGDAVPDVAVLKEIADLFGVGLDYMVAEEHPKNMFEKLSIVRKVHNHAFITAICVIAVWLIAEIVFLVLDAVLLDTQFKWLIFLFAVPVSFVVWLIFNSIWFNKRRNFLIISFLMWSVITSIYITILVFGFNLWKIFFLGILGQLIIIFWSKLKYRNQN